MGGGRRPRSPSVRDHRPSGGRDSAVRHRGRRRRPAAVVPATSSPAGASSSSAAAAAAAAAGARSRRRSAAARTSAIPPARERHGTDDACPPTATASTCRHLPPATGAPASMYTSPDSFHPHKPKFYLARHVTTHKRSFFLQSNDSNTMRESFVTKRLHCCLLLMSERRTCAYAACVAACRACRNVRVAPCCPTRATQHVMTFSCAKIHVLHSVSCGVVT